ISDLSDTTIMKGIFTILNYYFSPGRWAAQWPLTTAPAAVGDRNLHKWYFYHLSASNLVFVSFAPHRSGDRPRRRIGRSWGGISGRIFWQRTGPGPGESKCSAC